MSPKKRYPLEALLEQRERDVDERAGDLQQAQRRAREAEQARERAQRDRLAQQRLTREETRVEAERFDAGGAAAQDMMHLHAWRAVQARRTEALEAAEQRSQRQVREAEARQSAARQQLAEARARAQVIEKHRQRFTDEERKAQERRLEEEMEEQVHAGSSGRNG